MYKAGDKIFYPMYGAGIIECIETSEIFDVECEYYVMHTTHEKVKVMIPVKNCDQMGVRNIVSGSELDKALEIFSMPPTSMPDNWTKRQRENKDKMKTGDIFSLVEVIRNLNSLKGHKTLSTGEKKIMEDAIRILESEIMLVKDIELEDSKKLLSTYLV